MSDVPPPASNQPIADSYDASKLGKLEGLEAVRKKPGMYIGGTDERALHHCVSEVLDNSVDEHLAGHCKRIDVTIHVDGSISIRDDGRGIPVDIHPQYKIPGVEMVLTTLHSGGKYGQGGYKFSGGTHGVGAKCVNAVSEWFEVEVSRGGQVHHMKFERGKTVKKLEVIGKARGTGTLITFKPDPEIFRETTIFQSGRISQRLRELAFLNSGLEIVFTDERPADPKPETYYYKDGVEEFVKQLNQGKNPLHPKPVGIKKETRVKTDDKEAEIHVEVVLQYNDTYNDQVLCYTNTIHNPDGGTHLSGFRSALTRAINQFSKANNLLKEKDPQITGDDVREGLAAVISIKHSDPKFESQTKVKLLSPEVESIVGSASYEGLMMYFETNTGVAKRIVDKALNAARAREAARKARETVRKGPFPAVDCPASWLTARSAIRRWANFTSSRATPPVVRPSRGATAASRPSCRCAASSSTSRRRASTRCSPTRKSARSSRPSARASASGDESVGGFNVDKAALPQGHHHDRCRRGRLAHPHAAADVPSTGRCRG
jgi:DNA gyrase subunit B